MNFNEGCKYTNTPEPSVARRSEMTLMKDLKDGNLDSVVIRLFYRIGTYMLKE